MSDSLVIIRDGHLELSQLTYSIKPTLTQASQFRL